LPRTVKVRESVVVLKRNRYAELDSNAKRFFSLPKRILTSVAAAWCEGP